MSDKKNELKVVTKKFRVSFPELFVAKKFGDNGKENFSIKMLFDKKTDLSDLKAKVKQAAVEKWGANFNKKIDMPFADGDDKPDLAGYAGCIVVSASSKFKPQVIRPKFGPDGKAVEITDPKEIYAGCYARAAITAFAWEYSPQKNGPVMKRGVSFRLESVQKLEDGEPLVKRPDASKDFDSVDDGSDDDSNYESEDNFDDFMN